MIDVKSRQFFSIAAFTNYSVCTIISCLQIVLQNSVILNILVSVLCIQLELQPEFKNRLKDADFALHSRYSPRCSMRFVKLRDETLNVYVTEMSQTWFVSHFSSSVILHSACVREMSVGGEFLLL